MQYLFNAQARSANCLKALSNYDLRRNFHLKSRADKH